MPLAKTPAVAFVICAGLALSLGGLGPAPQWRRLDPDNTLIIDTTQGRMVVEMRPDLAPQAVSRVKLLAREGIYDGLLFHRVIDGFVDQTGNPNNRDGGASSHPDLPPEFTFRIDPRRIAAVRRASDGIEGFLGASPVAAVSAAEAARSKDGQGRAWGAYCPGVAGMGRGADPNSANSEIFFMRAASRRLDRDYTVWGRVVSGMAAVRGVAVGEPPAQPDRMLKVRVMADLPQAERPRLEVLDEHSPAFGKLVRETRRAKGADFTVCDIEVPVREAR